MSDYNNAPTVPDDLKGYNSYETDPIYARRLAVIYGGLIGLFVVWSLPSFIRSIRSGRAWTGTLTGVTEDLSQSGGRPYNHVGRITKIETVLSKIGSFFYWSLPGVNLNLGHVLLILMYTVAFILSIVMNAPLIANANRAGFIAMSQLPLVFLLGTKNSVLSLILGPGHGYEKLNVLHRWSGRLIFLAAVLHGSLWIRDHMEYGTPILGDDKPMSGIKALVFLTIVVLASLKPVRSWGYQFFFWIHTIGFVAFFVLICYHTPFAAPWIYPPLALYGFDILLRVFKLRIQNALLIPIGDQLTLIHVPFPTHGWIAGQHVRLRVFFRGRVFESHPFTIFSATPDVSCIRSVPKSLLNTKASDEEFDSGKFIANMEGMWFGVKSCGDWTKSLNGYAREIVADSEPLEEVKLVSSTPETTLHSSTATAHHSPPKSRIYPQIPIQVMLDGPYGGCSLDLCEYETVLLMAGGSGITFLLGVLDDLVGRSVRGQDEVGRRTRRVEFVWCVRSFGQIDWFSSALMDIATAAATISCDNPDRLKESGPPLDLHISIYVTCLCNPEAIPPIPNCDVLLTASRPDSLKVLEDLISPPSRPKSDSSSATPQGGYQPPVASQRLPWIASSQGGVGVCASGPESLTKDVANAVARLRKSSVGKVGLHTEAYVL